MAEEGKEILVNAPMVGKIIEIKVNAGDEVKEGDEVLTMESMKMEIPVFAPANGKVKKVLVSAGDSVKTGETLATLD